MIFFLSCLSHIKKYFLYLFVYEWCSFDVESLFHVGSSFCHKPTSLDYYYHHAFLFFFFFFFMNVLFTNLQDVMQDPHVAADGFPYEAKILRDCFDSGHDTSPMTNLNLEQWNLVANHALRSTIQEWQQKQWNLHFSFLFKVYISFIFFLLIAKIEPRNTPPHLHKYTTWANAQVAYCISLFIKEK